MYNSGNLEYIVGSNSVDKYEFAPIKELLYIPSVFSDSSAKYNVHEKYLHHYFHTHSFSPLIFLSPSRPNTRFVDDSSEARKIAKEVFELMMNEELPSDISINVLPLNDFRVVHSQFGSWNNGILGFSINGDNKLIFVREANLDSMLIVIGHEIGHVLTETLPNKHDEEAKAFAFSVEWAKIIKKHNIAGLGSSIKDETEFNPAKNGLHDVAFGFVDLMARKGRKAIQLHDDLVKRYVSILNKIYL